MPRLHRITALTLLLTLLATMLVAPGAFAAPAPPVEAGLKAEPLSPEEYAEAVASSSPDPIPPGNDASGITAQSVTPQTVTRRFPVVFIPGIGGSYLATESPPWWCLGILNPFCWTWGSSYKVWLTIDQALWSSMPWSDIKTYMELNPDGTPREEDSLYPDGVIRWEGNDVYGDHLNWMAETKGYLEDSENNDGWLSTFAYDFRLSIDTNADRLATHVDQVLRATRAEKVILTAHSTGGLIARTYIVNTKGAKVKGLVTMGTPWLGSPQLTKAMTSGWNFGINVFDSAIALMTKNWPGAHALAPGIPYFTPYPSGFVQTGSGAMSQQDQLAYQRAFNPTIFDQTSNWRTRIFNGQAYAVQTYAIAADAGPGSTIIQYRPDLNGDGSEDPVMGYGDDTVPLASGLVGCDRDAEANPDHTCGKSLIGPFKVRVATGTAENPIHHGNMTAHPSVQSILGPILDEIQTCANCGELYAPAFTAYDGKQNIVRTRLTNGQGQPLSGQTVYIDWEPICTNCGYFPIETPLTTDAEGWAAIRLGRWVYGSKWKIKYTYPGDGTYSPDYQEQIITVQQSPKGALSGTVFSSVLGHGVPADIGVYDDTGAQYLYLNSWSPDYKFGYPTLAFGDWTLKATTFGHAPVEIPFSITGGQTTNVNVTFDTRTVQPPAITGLSRPGGPREGGNTVTITGTDFLGTSQVLFGSNPATSFITRSGTKIEAVAPPGTGTVDVKVVATMGNSLPSTVTKYIYGDLPAITAISPARGPEAGGTTVSLTGTHLSGATQVTMGTVPVASFTVISDTQIDLVTRPSSGIQDLQVTTPIGVSPLGAETKFTYYPPAISLDGWVRLQNGTGVDSAVITLMDGQGQVAAGPVFTSPAGAFRLDGVGEGSYRLRAWNPLYLPAEVDVSVSQGLLTTPADGLNLVLPSGDLNGDGRVDTSDLTPLAAAFGSAVVQGGGLDGLNLVPDDRIDLQDLALLARDLGPKVGIIWPRPDGTFDEHTQTVKFLAREIVKYRVLVNGTQVKEAAVTAPGQFSEPVTLVTGSNMISVVGEAASGETETASVTVKARATPPQLSLVSPSWTNGEFVNLAQGDPLLDFDNNLSLTVESDPDVTVTATANWNTPVTLTRDGSLFTGAVQLTYGTNTLTIKATNADGKETTLSYTVSLMGGFPGGDPGGGGGW